MARNYVPPAVMAAEVFVNTFFQDESESVIEEVILDAVILRGDPEPSCLLDAIYLWLQSGWRAETSTYTHHPFNHCATYESWLVAVMVITDMWLRMPERFVWPNGIGEKYGLEPIRDLFPSLPEEDILTERDTTVPRTTRDYDRGEMTLDIMYAQYDHPALRRDSWEHWRDMARKGFAEWRQRFPSGENLPAF